MTDNRKYTAAIYCRLSEEDRTKANSCDDSGSIINQKELLTAYCRENGWDIYDIYSDDDHTGSDRNRPEFNRMLKDAENGKFNLILCKTQSRFTREIELVERYINYLLPLWGIRFISVVDNADTENKSNKKSRQINGLINEWYLEDMSDNIRAVLTSKRKNGYFIGAFAPYGYKKDPDKKGHLIIDEAAAENVRLIFRLYNSGMGKAAAAREMNMRGIPSPAEYKKMKGEKYRSRSSAPHSLWRYYTVGNILSNRVYLGDLVQGKAHSISYKSKKVKALPQSEWICIRGTHEAIIDEETWNEAQRKSIHRPTASSHLSVNIFSGKIFCSECGKALRMTKGGPKNKSRRYLRCSTRYYSPDECIGVNISYDKLCSMAEKEFQRICELYLDEDKVMSMIKSAEEDGQRVKNEKELSRLEKEAELRKEYLKSIYIDKITGITDEKTYLELRERFTEEISELEQKAEAIRTTLYISSYDDPENYTIQDILYWRKPSFDFTELFIDKIVIHPKKAYSREENAEIFWKI